MKWFRDEDGTYFRNIILIDNERKRALTRPWLWWRIRSLEREWWSVFRQGVRWRTTLRWFDRVVEPQLFREAYPQHPMFWTLDEDWPREASGLPALPGSIEGRAFLAGLEERR